jgi:hypothetical protein
MSSTLYGRGTLLQTGVKQRTDRMDQAIRDLHQLLEVTRQELASLKIDYAALTHRMNHVYAVTGIPNDSPTANAPPTESGTV